jgi:hypothetical protein
VARGADERDCAASVAVRHALTTSEANREGWRGLVDLSLPFAPPRKAGVAEALWVAALGVWDREESWGDEVRGRGEGHALRGGQARALAALARALHAAARAQREGDVCWQVRYYSSLRPHALVVEGRIH